MEDKRVQACQIMIQKSGGSINASVLAQQLREMGLGVTKLKVWINSRPEFRFKKNSVHLVNKGVTSTLPKNNEKRIDNPLEKKRVHMVKQSIQEQKGTVRVGIIGALFVKNGVKVPKLSTWIKGRPEFRYEQKGSAGFVYMADHSIYEQEKKTIQFVLPDHLMTHFITDTASYRGYQHVELVSCTSNPKTKSAVDRIRRDTYTIEFPRSSIHYLIGVDCEGVNLGREGQITLIQVASKTTLTVFDLTGCKIAGSHNVVIPQPLKELLQDENIFKAIHDCRNDTKALYYQCGVELQPVFDTQIANKIIASEIDGVVTPPRIGLSTLLKKYAMSNSSLHKLKEEVSKEMRSNFGLWRKRPLQPRYFLYAISDVLYLTSLASILWCRLQANGLHPWELALSESAQVIKNILADGDDKKEGRKKGKERSLSTRVLEDCMRLSTFDDIDTITALLPTHIGKFVEDNLSSRDSITDIILDIGKPVWICRYDNVDSYSGGYMVITKEDIDFVVDKLDRITTDNRAGISGTLHRLGLIRDVDNSICGITCRVGRIIEGLVPMMKDFLCTKESILILGRPGVGKTSIIREMARYLSQENRVMIVDTSSEIAGYDTVPHRAVGMARRMIVKKREEQHHVMVEAVQNHSPDVIIIDEIGTTQEAFAVRSIVQRGVKLIGTAHGNTLRDIILSPVLKDLAGGVQSVILSKTEVEQRAVPSRMELQSKAPPSFSVCVEVHSRSEWVIHHNVAKVIPNILKGKKFVSERRSYNETTGKITVSEQVQEYARDMW